MGIIRVESSKVLEGREGRREGGVGYKRDSSFYVGGVGGITNHGR